MRRGKIVKHLTKRAIDALVPGAREYFVWDDEIRGFCVRVRPNGSDGKAPADQPAKPKGYFFQYRVDSGPSGTRRPLIGNHGSITCDKARQIAGDWAAKVRAGGDPGKERKEARKALTLTQFWDVYLPGHVEHKAPRSIEEDKRNWKQHIEPVLGTAGLTTIGKSEVQRVLNRLHDKPVTHNRVRALLCHMLKFAESTEHRPPGSSPCPAVKKLKEKARKRYLTADEFARLAKALDASGESAAAVNAIRLLALTGCRRNEILTLQWRYVDFKAGCLRLPRSKTGEKDVLLSTAALRVLSSLKRAKGNPHVFPGRNSGSHLTDLEKPWQRIRAKAKLKDVRLHDLRHSFASFGVAAGLSLPMIGGLLGHADAETTNRYAHLMQDPARRATEQISSAIDAAMQGKGGDVVQFKKQKK